MIPKTLMGQSQPQRRPDERHPPNRAFRAHGGMGHPGKLLSQKQLLRNVRGPGYDSASGNPRLYMAQVRR